ncbi:MAG: selenocysteine-specific translation elongation factor [Rubrivivax sp.]
MIVGTAGHIDHGKTTLVRALTGVDTDRLPEEKARGISIELGYAFLDAPGASERIGFIDVPGHERLVHTMIAGATGIDHALLLVAADDGPMPQTREHLAVLSLLGLANGAVVVTKADRVDAARLAAVVAEAQALVEGSTLAGAPVFAVSAASGQGLEPLREHLFEAARAAAAPAADDRAFRLAVDRVFTLGGVGTVVSGTVHAGRVAVGDELRLVPGDRSVRVRSLHAQNQPVAAAHAGQRCALALAGVEKQDVARGQWLVAPPAALATDRLDATLELWAGEAQPLRSGTPVHVHLGSASTLGTVAVLDGAQLAPGARGRVQLVLRERMGAWAGEPVVLRDAAAARTLAGGRVLDPFAPVRYRRTPQRLAELDAQALPDPEARLAALLAAAPTGVDLKRHAAAQGRALPPLPEGALRQSEAQGDWALGVAQAEAARTQVLAALAAFHAAHPDEAGPDAARLRRLALPRLPEPLWRALLAALQAEGRVVQRGAFVHLPEHGVRLSATEERIAQKTAPALAGCGFEGAWVRDLARDAAESEALVRVTLARLAQRGDLHQVVKDLYLPPATMAKLGAIARTLAAAQGGEVTAAAFRDATALGRKRAIQILEYLDRIGLLRRVGDVHRLRGDSRLFEAAA